MYMHGKNMLMNAILMFALLTALGLACYLVFFKLVDWFGKI